MGKLTTLTITDMLLPKLIYPVGRATYSTAESPSQAGNTGGTATDVLCHATADQACRTYDVTSECLS
jgi:hypothetical protein